MAITRVWIEEGCISCGTSEDNCPEVFKVKEVATVIEGVNYSEFEEKIKRGENNKEISEEQNNLVDPKLETTPKNAPTTEAS